MDELTVFGPECFELKPDREEVFKWLQCGESLPSWDAFSDAWDEAVSLLHCLRDRCCVPDRCLLRCLRDRCCVLNRCLLRTDSRLCCL